MDSKHTIKNITFTFGLAFLLYGALTFGYQDWDVGVSLVMAGFTYVCADWVVGVLRRSEYRKYPAALFLTWWCIDGCYTAYWMLVNEEAMVRGQWWASLMMFLLCGVIWQALPTPREALGLFRATKDRFLSHQ